MPTNKKTKQIKNASIIIINNAIINILVIKNNSSCIAD